MGQTPDTICLHYCYRSRMERSGKEWVWVQIPDSGECLVTKESCDGLRDPCEHRERLNMI